MYSSNEFLQSAGVSRHMQATGETPSQKTEHEAKVLRSSAWGHIFEQLQTDLSTCSLSRPPSYDQLSRRSVIEGDAQGMTSSSIEGVLWSDEEENEYFYHENITSAWNEGQAGKNQEPCCVRLNPCREEGAA
ncbi:hypothetical protein ACJJTC_018364 [Scirpophaga incertulas]